MPRFITLALLLQACLIATVAGATHSPCQARHIDSVADVATVIDGDTIILQDHTRVRLIGINTPELRRQARTAEAFAEQARKRLQALMQASSHRIMLQYGQQRRDRYGRLLAHVFLRDGTDVAGVLLREGLAMRIALPPNLWAQHCYQAAEAQARGARRGLWRDTARNSDALGPGDTGFQRVTGRVVRVGHSRKSVWLNLDGHFAARIARTDLGHFTDINLDQLNGQTIEVRGWVVAQGRQTVMRLHHSSMIDIVK